MKTPNTPDQVTRDNRKNWPKFILVMLLCMAGGAVLGYGSAWLVGSYSFDALADAAGRAAGACAPFAVLAAVPFLLAALACCRRARALFAAWDGEDEEIPARADARLDWALVWLTTAQLLALLLFAVSVSAGLRRAGRHPGIGGGIAGGAVRRDRPAGPGGGPDPAFQPGKAGQRV